MNGFGYGDQDSDDITSQPDDITSKLPSEEGSVEKKNETRVTHTEDVLSGSSVIDKKSVEGKRETGISHHEWFEHETGMVDAFSAYAHIEAVKAANREKACGKEIRNAKLKGQTTQTGCEDEIRESGHFMEAGMRSVMISRLPKDVSETQLRLLFLEISTGMSFREWKEKGSSTSVSEGLLSDAISRIEIVRGTVEDREENICIGYAHVEFESVSHATKALSLASETGFERLLPNPTGSKNIGNTKTVVKISTSKTVTRAPLELYQLYLGGIPLNLSKDAVQQEILDKFVEADIMLDGCVLNIELVLDRATGKSMGFAFMHVQDHLVDRVLDAYKNIYKLSHNLCLDDQKLQSAEANPESPPLDYLKPICNANLPPEQILCTYGMWTWSNGHPVFLKRVYQKPLTIGAGRYDHFLSISNSSLFIANLPMHITEVDLKAAVKPFGVIVSLRILHLKRLCFLSMAEPLQALAALTHLNGTFLKGYRMSMSYGSSAGYHAHHVRKEVVLDHSDKYQEAQYDRVVSNSLQPVDYDINPPYKHPMGDEPVSKKVKQNALESLVAGSMFSLDFK